jgi:hypothetical protein
MLRAIPELGWILKSLSMMLLSMPELGWILKSLCMMLLSLRLSGNKFSLVSKFGQF